MSRAKKGWLIGAGAASFLLSLAGPMALIGALWAFGALAREPLARLLARIPAGWGFVLAAWLAGMLIESLAILDNLPLPRAERVLFDPDPATDLLLASTFYAVVAVTWWLLLRVRDFPTWGVFVVTGLWGMVAENSGAVLAVALANPLLGVPALLLVAIVYGSFPGIGAMLGRRSLARVKRERPRPRWWWYGTALLALFAQHAIYGNTFWRVLQMISGS